MIVWDIVIEISSRAACCTSSLIINNSTRVQKISVSTLQASSFTWTPCSNHKSSFIAISTLHSKTQVNSKASTMRKEWTSPLRKIASLHKIKLSSPQIMNRPISSWLLKYNLLIFIERRQLV